MDSVNLNMDILHLIMARSDQITVSQIMKTCHSLNREGVKYLLHSIPTLWTVSQALSFLQFALPSSLSSQDVSLQTKDASSSTRIHPKDT